MPDNEEKPALKDIPPEVLRRIALFAERYGQTWKEHLSSAWLSGKDETMPDGALLRQARNHWADQLFSDHLAEGLTRLYRLTWTEGYDTTTGQMFNGEFTDDDSFTQEFRDFVSEISPGEERRWSDPSGVILVRRVF